MPNREVQQSPRAEPRFFYGYIVVAASFCTMAAIFGAHLAFGVFFTPMLNEFGWTRAMTAGAFSLSMFLHGLLGIVMGGLNDKFGPRVVMTLCGFLLGLGYCLSSRVSSIWHLYLFYGVIMGIGMGGAWVPLLSTVARWFVARRGTMSGIVLVGMSTGSFIGPLVANWLISTYDWRTSYIIMGSVVFVVVVLAAQFLKRDPTQIGQVPYGGNREKEQGLKAADEGLSLREAVYTRRFWMFLAAFFCLGICVFAVTVHIVPHAIVLGISATNAANILATSGGLAIIGRVVMGGAADRIGNRQVLLIGFILLALTLFWLVPARDLWMLYLFAVVFGFAYSGMGPAQSPLVAQLFGLRYHGLIFGVNNFSFTVGSAIGPVLAGYIFDVTGNYQVAFLTCAAIAIVGLIFTVLITPVRGGRDKIANL